MVPLNRKTPTLQENQTHLEKEMATIVNARHLFDHVDEGGMTVAAVHVDDVPLFTMVDLDDIGSGRVTHLPDNVIGIPMTDCRFATSAVIEATDPVDAAEVGLVSVTAIETAIWTGTAGGRESEIGTTTVTLETVAGLEIRTENENGIGTAAGQESVTGTTTIALETAAEPGTGIETGTESVSWIEIAVSQKSGTGITTVTLGTVARPE